MARDRISRRLTKVSLSPSMTKTTRDIDISVEGYRSRKTGRVTRRLVARIGSGFTDDFYKTRPKGSIVAWTRYDGRRERRDIIVVRRRAVDKLRTQLIRKGLVERIKKLRPVPGATELRDDDIKVGKNLISVSTSSVMSHQGRMACEFKVYYVISDQKERSAVVIGMSSRTAKPVSRLTNREYRALLEQCSRSAAARVMESFHRTSDMIVDVVQISKPWFVYDIGIKSGKYQRPTYEDKTGRRRVIKRRAIKGFTTGQRKLPHSFDKRLVLKRFK